MIITLKGDNFSANNIGTLSTWTILRVLGDGAIYNGVSYVDKNATLNATVTIADGYELGSSGISVTMGGNPVTSGVTLDGNTITINIASVTGNVVIKVPTVNMSTGEESSGVVKIERKGTGVQAVPNNEIVEKLVFNTNLTTSEVDTILSNANLTFVDFEGAPIYPIFVNEENRLGIIIVNYGTLIGDGTIAYVIMEFESGLCIYSSSTVADLSNLDGWNFDLFEQLGGGNEFPVNMEANSTYNGLAVGSQNDAIKDIINVGSVEPYLKELKGTYEPIDIEITENTTIDLATTYMDNKQMPVNLNVEVVPNLQEKTITPTWNAQTITSDSDYDGLSKVTIEKVEGQTLEVEGKVLSGTQDNTQTFTCSSLAQSYKKVIIKPATPPNTFLGSALTEILPETYNSMTLSNVTANYVTKIGKYAFMGSSIKSFTSTSVETIDNSVFHSCGQLEKVDLSNVVSMGDGNFYACSKLKALIIRTTSQVCSLVTTASSFDMEWSFYNTPIANGTGYIYVPDDLVESYKADTNWSTYANQIKPLSEYVEA